MAIIHPKDLSVPKLQSILQTAVAPRPIALASTTDSKGNVNLSPYSFFNVFSSNPPILIFSPARRVRDNTEKHTLENIKEIPEVVIHAVNYAIVQQTSLSSTEYAKGVNEFIKAGFTQVPSEVVKPPRVKESPIAFECKVKEVIPLGTEGGAGNLVISEVVLIHIVDEVLDKDGNLVQTKLDLVARLGGDYYCRTCEDSLFKVPKPLSTLGIGIDQLPREIKFSKVFSGNDLAQLANIERLPEGNFSDDEATHRKAKEVISVNIMKAWEILKIN